MRALFWPDGLNVERLRPLPTADELAAMYPAPHDHFLYGRGHGERVDATIRLARQALEWSFLAASVGDLSCGNGFIARAIARQGDELHLGDFAGVPTSSPAKWATAARSRRRST